MPEIQLADAQQQIGANIRRLRGEQLTQQALADRLGMSVQYLSRIERGDVNLTIKMIVRLANALEARLSDLTRSTHVRPPKPGRPKKRRTTRTA